MTTVSTMTHLLCKDKRKSSTVKEVSLETSSETGNSKRKKISMELLAPTSMECMSISTYMSRITTEKMV